MSTQEFTVVEESKDDASGRHLRIIERRGYREMVFDVQELGGRFSQPGVWTAIDPALTSLDQARESVRLSHLHTVELRSLPRPSLYGRNLPRTPWGQADSGTSYAEGISGFGTSSHGGMKLDAKNNAKVHPALRNRGGWYEEDGEKSKVVWTFQSLFTTREVAQARDYLVNTLPHEFMEATGEVIATADSRKLVEEAFYRDNAGKWMVISASTRDDGDTACIATIDGKRTEWNKPPVEERTFIVPKGEYDYRGLPFVIDESRHEEVVDASPRP